ncbi:MmgE/PrpD family protein [soil metagenome]
MDAVADTLAQFIHGGAVDARTRSSARDAVIDTLAVTLAGCRGAGVLALEGTLSAERAGFGVPCLWSDRQFRSDDSALLVGMAAHALDYDDVSMIAITHPSAPVLAALLAGTDWETTTGLEICDALAVGTEVAIRLGEAIGFSLYELGFHSTAVLGVFGATAALARLHRLDPTTTRQALGMAASLASGLRVNFGSMTKPLHVGIAASNGHRAVSWAKAGLTSADGDVFTNRGFFQAFSGGLALRWPDEVAVGDPFVISDPGFERKRFPCCYLTHRMIAASLQLAAAHDLHLASVRSIRVILPRGGALPLIHPRPTTGQEARFSGPYSVLAALHDRAIGFSSFTDSAVARPEIRDRLDDVSLLEVGDEALTPAELGRADVTVVVTLVDGRVVSHVQTTSPGSPQDPLTRRELRAKWVDCLRHGTNIPEFAASRLFDMGDDLAKAEPVGRWLTAIRQAAAPQDRMRAASA